MKLLSLTPRPLSLLFGTFFLFTACNQEEFFKAEEFLVGEDAYCFQEGPDQDSCEALGDRCRVAYLEGEDETQAPDFLMCIANPDYDDNTSGSDIPGDDLSSGDSSNGTNDEPGSGSGSDTDTDHSTPPTIEDTVTSNCSDLDKKYLWVKVEKDNKGKKTQTKKVKVCHHSAWGEHNILIACPALRAHLDHHEDELGVCQE